MNGEQLSNSHVESAFGNAVVWALPGDGLSVPAVMAPWQFSTRMQACAKSGDVTGEKKVSSASVSCMDHSKSLRLATSPEA